MTCPGFSPRPGPARRLHQKLKGPLRRPVVRQIEANVPVSHHSQRHMREMVPFRKHLGADKDLRLLPGKRLKDLLHAPRAAGAVPIQAQNPASRRQKRPDILFDTLGSLPPWDGNAALCSSGKAKGTEPNTRNSGRPAALAPCGRSNRYHNAGIGPPSHSRCSTSAEHNRADSGEPPPDPPAPPSA